MKRHIFITLSLFASLLFADGESERIRFEYQSLLEPFPKYECTHEKSNVGLFEWDVQCNVDGILKKYFVHLVTTFYPETLFGVNSYEILYWVTDTSLSHEYKNNSVTLWLHNSSKENKMNLFETFLGIENDKASLRLTYLLK